MPSICPGGISGVACHVLPFVPIVGGWAGAAHDTAPKAVKAVTGSVLSDVSSAMASAADGLLNTLSTLWMNIGTPDLSGSGSPVAVIQNDVGWVTTYAAVVCILAAAARMAIRRRGEPAAAMALGLGRLVVVSAAGTFLVEAAGKLADAFSSDLMSTAHLGTGGWSGLISTATLSAAFAPGDGMLLIIALLVVLSSLIQLMLMILRVGLLVILTGTLPLAAAASMSEWGENWWRKHLAWLTAWLVYKPAAAVFYAGAFALTHDGQHAVEVISGFMLLVLSVLILPALLRVIVPMTASPGAASSGTLAMGAAGALATGAIKLGSAGIGGLGAAAATGAATTGAASAGTALTDAATGPASASGPPGSALGRPGRSSATHLSPGSGDLGEATTPGTDGGNSRAGTTTDTDQGQVRRAGPAGLGRNADPASDGPTGADDPGESDQGGGHA